MLQTDGREEPTAIPPIRLRAASKGKSDWFARSEDGPDGTRPDLEIGELPPFPGDRVPRQTKPNGPRAKKSAEELSAELEGMAAEEPLRFMKGKELKGKEEESEEKASEAWFNREVKAAMFIVLFTAACVVFANFGLKALENSLLPQSSAASYPLPTLPRRQIVNPDTTKADELVRGRVFLVIDDITDPEFCLMQCLADAQCMAWTMYMCGEDDGDGDSDDDDPTPGNKTAVKPPPHDDPPEQAKAVRPDVLGTPLVTDEMAFSRAPNKCYLKDKLELDRSRRPVWARFPCALSGIVERKEQMAMMRSAGAKDMAACLRDVKTLMPGEAHMNDTCVAWIGQVQDAQTGVPLPGCDIVASRSQQADSLFAKVVSDNEGIFVFPHVPVGVVEVAYICEGRIPEERSVVVPATDVDAWQRLYPVPLMMADTVRILFEWNDDALNGVPLIAEVNLPGTGCTVDRVDNPICNGDGFFLTRDFNFGAAGPQLFSITGFDRGLIWVRAKFPFKTSLINLNLQVSIFVSNLPTGRYILTPKDLSATISVDGNSYAVWNVAAVSGAQPRTVQPISDKALGFASK